MAEYFGAEVPAAEESEMTLGSWAGLTALPSPYTSPPYLTARPDITSLQVRGPSSPSLLFFFTIRYLIDKKLALLTFTCVGIHPGGLSRHRQLS